MLATVLLVWHPWNRNVKLVAGSSDTETIQTLQAYTQALQKSAVDEDGCVSPEDASRLTSEFYDAASKAVSQGEYAECHKNDSCVYVKLESGLGFIYVPQVEGTLESGTDAAAQSSGTDAAAQSSGTDAAAQSSGTDAAAQADVPTTSSIYCFEPFSSSFGDPKYTNTSPINGFVDEVAQEISTQSGGKLGTSGSDMHNADVNLRSITQMGSQSVVIWYGHAWDVPVDDNGGSASALVIGQSGTDTMQNIDRGSTYIAEAYGQGIASDINLKTEILVNQNDQIAVMPAFFENHLADGALDGDVIYLGACNTAKSPALAQAFLDKGAQAVFGYDGSVQPGYCMNMFKLLFEGMAGQASNTYPTAADALASAKAGISSIENTDGSGTWGATDDFGDKHTSLVLMGDNGSKLCSLWEPITSSVYNALLDDVANGDPAYQFSEDTLGFSPTGEHQYALADLDGDGSPELILATETIGPYYCTIYTVANRALSTIDGSFQMGGWLVSSARAAVMKASDGNGLVEYTFMAGTGLGYLERLNVQDGKLVITDLGDCGFRFGSSEADAFFADYPSLDWYDISERSPLS